MNIAVIKYFRNDTFRKKNITTTEVAFIQLLSYNVVSKQKKIKNENENTECHVMFIPFKSHLNLKQGSLIFLLFGSWSLVRSSHPEVFCEKGVLRNLAKLTENTCAKVSFLIKLQAYSLRPTSLLKSGSGTGIFMWICKISKNTFFDRTPLVTASV